MTSLPRLKFLDVRFMHKLDNSILDAALSNITTPIYIRCSDTKVDPIKFVYDHPTTSKTLIDGDLYSYSFENLRFETFATMRHHQRLTPVAGGDDVWDEDAGYFYMGSEFEDSDLEQYFPGEILIPADRQNRQQQQQAQQQQESQKQEARPAEARRPLGDFYDDDESDPDDFDDFINNDETEMYNELDEY